MSWSSSSWGDISGIEREKKKDERSQSQRSWIIARWIPPHHTIAGHRNHTSRLHPWSRWRHRLRLAAPDIDLLYGLKWIDPRLDEHSDILRHAEDRGTMHETPAFRVDDISMQPREFHDLGLEHRNKPGLILENYRVLFLRIVSLIHTISDSLVMSLKCMRWAQLTFQVIEPHGEFRNDQVSQNLSNHW